MRRAARTDANHADIVAALRACGCSVLSLAPMGRGVPDLLCARAGISWLVECKDGHKPPSARSLTADQDKFMAGWRGEVYVCNGVAEVPQIVSLAVYGRGTA